MSALTLTQHREPDPERMAALRARCAGAGEPGFLGCGHCRACRRDRARALARPDCDRPYLGPVPLPSRPVECRKRLRKSLRLTTLTRRAPMRKSLTHTAKALGKPL